MHVQRLHFFLAVATGENAPRRQESFTEKEKERTQLSSSVPLRFFFHFLSLLLALLPFRSS